MKQKFANYFLSASMAVGFLSIAMISCSNSQADEDANDGGKYSIRFYKGSLENAAASAKKENRQLFVMVHASWCAVCKKIKREVLPQKELGDFFNAHFVNIMVDFDSDEGKILRKQYEVTGTPTFLYLSAQGRLLNKTSGFQGPGELIAAAKDLKIEGKPVCN
jgi:thioredoxin 1